MAAFSTWNGVAAQGYQPITVDFDGFTYLSRVDPVGISDASTGILALQLRVDGGSAERRIITNGGGGGFTVTLNSSGFLACELAASGGRNLSFQTTSALTVSSTWKIVLLSWDTNYSTGNRLSHLYVNDVSSKSVTLDSGGAFSVDYTSGAWAIGAGTGGTQGWDGCMGELYFAAGQYLDFSTESNRRKFIDASGRPVFLGATGTLPTGSAPTIYLRNPVATYGTNSGTGGDFTVNGTLTSCSTAP